VGVQAAGVGEDPQSRRAQQVVLRADGGAGTGERGAVRRDAQHRDEARATGFGQGREPDGAVTELGGGQLGGAAGGR
jgi:hypothetical protein